MRKKTFVIVFIVFLSQNSSAQFTRYVVKLKDKAGTPYSVDDPAKFLSVRSVSRRSKQHIPIDETDLPVSPQYIDSIRLSGNVVILDQSKWLNQVCIATTDSSAIDKINRFPFVVATRPLKRTANSKLVLRNKWEDSITKNKFSERSSDINSPLSPRHVSGDYYSYGDAFDQVHIHKGEYLHNKGFHGEGMLIAILDAGFYHYQSLPAFDSVNLRRQVVETYDFVNNETSVNEDHYHGMMCFSIIGGNISGQLVGTCPNANFLLYRSEDVDSESPVEEQYWAAAAERADSAGADVITTSLGYNTFDNPVFNYSYSDMNGHTTLIAREATMAARKGMIVLAAAGNEGNDTWHFIITPADADSIISVGAVNSLGEPAAFSSYGPSSDGRVEPVAASVGEGTFVSSTTGPIIAGNGTSFATPNLAGLVTCLWQAFPEFTNTEIINAVKKSSSIYNNPDDRIGYGIPDFQKAYDDLYHQRIVRAEMILGNQNIKIYPNPFKDNFTVIIKPMHTSPGNFKIYDVSGKLYFIKQVALQAGVTQIINFTGVPAFQKGMYILRFSDGISKESFKLMGGQ
jgi:serine protease AprX